MRSVEIEAGREGRRLRIWPFGAVEERASATDTVVEAILRASSDGSKPTVTDIGALEIAAGLWARGFASAVVTPAIPALDAGTLALIGRALCVYGESVFRIRLDTGRLELDPAGSVKVTGGYRRDSWRYTMKLEGPDRSIEAKSPYDEVLHFKYAVTPGKPWKGTGPLGACTDTQALAAWLERGLAREAASPSGYVLPMPENRGGDDLKTDLTKLKGGLAVVDTTVEGYGDGRDAAPRRDWESKRLGAAPPDSLRALRSDVGDTVLGACGVANIVSGGGSTGLREAWRAFLFGTLQPVSELVSAELSAKLGADYRFDFAKLGASDLTGRARAMKSLVDSGVALDEAKIIAGF